MLFTGGSPPTSRSSGKHVTRRQVLSGSSGLVGLVLGHNLARAADPYPFTLGVASGDPSPDGFVLWTRLAPIPL
jgi:alkaline phosphatase D